MASRIITKKGSGAPLASDLVHGELAVDTVNKRLYTENAGGTVVELGTSPSTIDINGGTIDGTVIGGTTAAAVTTTALVATTADINAGTIDGTVIGGTTAAAGTFTTFTSTGIDDNATSTAITIDASENVGIGKLTVAIDATGGGLPTSNLMSVVDTQDMALGNGGGIKFGGVFTTGGTFNPDMAFIKAAKSNATSGNFSYDLIFGTRPNAGNPTERMRIDSSGNVSIGTTGAMLGSSGRGNVTINGASSAILSLGVGGSFRSYFFTDGTNTELWNSQNGAMIFGTNNAERARIDSSGNVGIANTSPAVKLDVTGQIRASTGILFGSDTAAANTLDDYEEGTWTPAQGSGLTVVGAYTSSGRYTKIGRFVLVSGRIFGATSVTTTAGGQIFTGLPFAVLEQSAVGNFTNGSIDHNGGLGLFGTQAYASTSMSADIVIDFTAVYQV